MQVEALQDLHFPRNKTIKKETKFDIKKIKVNDKALTEEETKVLKSKNLIKEVK